MKAVSADDLAEIFRQVYAKAAAGSLRAAEILLKYCGAEPPAEFRDITEPVTPIELRFDFGPEPAAIDSPSLPRLPTLPSDSSGNENGNGNGNDDGSGNDY
jgi:hypothetical protein